MTVETKAQLINLIIDGTAISVPKGTTVYQAARQLGIDVPIFCYQDRMPPFGACRVCLVEVEKFPKLQTSCTLEATEGMVVKTQSDPAVQGREGILEFLLVNHPLDCPICDRGGECPLQDQALKFGPGESRFTEEKRHFTKALPLGSVLMLDRERCIVCARCTRFGDEVAGDHALQFIDRGFRTEVGTPDGKPVESKFIGNTIMICPVGALTSQVYRFRARPWDNKPTETTCTLCPVGCSMILDSRDGEIMRTRSRENKSLNDIWLCDKGWFGYEFNSNPDRLSAPLIRKNGKLEKADWEEALSLVASKIQQSNKDKVAGIGGNALTVEENYLFQKLVRDSIGSANVDHRVGTPIFSLDEEGLEAGMEMKVGECEELNYAILLGLDLTEEFPIVWLRLKQAINNGAKVFFVGHYAPEISRYLKEIVTHAPGAEIELIQQKSETFKELAKNGKGAVFVGSQYLHMPNRKAILSEVLKLKQTLPNAKLNIMEGRDNSVGARFAGMRPDLSPAGAKVSRQGLSSAQVFNETAKSGWDLLLVAGSNPAAKVSAKTWKEVRAKTKFIVVQDLFLTDTAKDADVVLPVLGYTEKSGSFINIEGRVQKIRQGKKIDKNLKTDSEIFVILGEKIGKRLIPEQTFIDKLNQEFVSLPRKTQLESGKSASHTNNPLSATFAHALFDNGVRISHDPHLIKLAKEPKVRLNPTECFKRNLKDGDKISIKANGTTVSSKVKSDDKVPDGTAVLPLGFKNFHVQDLTNDYLNGIAVEIVRGDDSQEKFKQPYA